MTRLLALLLLAALPLLTACSAPLPMGFVTSEARYRPVIHPSQEGSLFVEVEIPIPPQHRYPSQLVIHQGGSYYLPSVWTKGNEESVTIRVRSGLAEQGLTIEGHRAGEPCCLSSQAEWTMETGE